MVLGLIHQVFKFNWDKNRTTTTANDTAADDDGSENMSINELNSMLTTAAVVTTKVAKDKEFMKTLKAPATTTTSLQRNTEQCNNNNNNNNNNNKMNNSEHHHHRQQQQQQNNSLLHIYLLFIIVFSSIFLLTILLFSYVNKSTDITVLRNKLKSDFIVSDIKQIVKVILQDLKDDNNYYNNIIDGSTLRYDIKSAADFVRVDDDKHYDDVGSDGSNGDLYSADTDVIKNINEFYMGNERKASQLHNIIRERREASILSNNMVTSGQSEANQGSIVDFFNPKIRRELEKKDEEIKRMTGQKGAAPGGDEWVWLTSYSRIPYDAITGFCSATKEYCPVGPAGIPGQPGMKGYRGDIGIPGPSGREGIPGARGPKGMPGNPGLDGRDGVPGEPGLDGVPGRAGADGTPGKDGKDGIPGNDGQNGQNGRDGREGLLGPQGPPGLPGEKGMDGPRGRTGRPGTNGTPGLSGVIAYRVNVNESVSYNLLVPPSIIPYKNNREIPNITIYEGDNLRLRCAATGIPEPIIEWRRDDTALIAVGSWKAYSVPGHSLNITKINRVHSGTYICTADNGIPPIATTKFNIEVHFPPLITINKQYISVSIGSTITLECKIEAFPDPLKYWKRNNVLIDPSDKFRMESIAHGGYHSTMLLTIRTIGLRDFGEYKCSVKNLINQTDGIFYIEDKNKLPPRIIKDEQKEFGPGRPKLKTYEDLCPPPCPICPEYQCKDNIVSINDLVGQLEITTLENVNHTELKNRSFNCQLHAVGKPVYHKYTDNIWYGAWLKDPLAQNDDSGEKIWTTSVNDSTHIYEYSTKIKYRTNSGAKKYDLNHPGFKGNAHIVYNGSFYYHQNNSNKIVKYDLDARKILATNHLYKLAYNGSNYLYTSEENYIDFNADDNGLWAIYSTPDSNHTIVVKLDPYDLSILYSWNISINHHKVGEMFIVCGVLYAVDSVTERSTFIRLALDLYHNRLIPHIKLPFTNPFKRTTTIGYNHRMKELYTWDKGNQLAYPTRYHDMGYNITSSNEKLDENFHSQLNTGYEVESIH